MAKAKQAAKQTPAKPVLPPAPEWLGAAARAEWERSLSTILERDVAGIDLSLYEIYCQAFARWQDAERHLLEHGTEVVIRNDKGEVKSVITSPQVQVSAKAYDQMVKARRSCGLERAREIIAAGL